MFGILSAVFAHLDTAYSNLHLGLIAIEKLQARAAAIGTKTSICIFTSSPYHIPTPHYSQNEIFHKYHLRTNRGNVKTYTSNSSRYLQHLTSRILPRPSPRKNTIHLLLRLKKPRRHPLRLHQSRATFARAALK